MHIQTLPLSKLKPAPYNPRVTLEPGMPGYDKLARSLDEFDLVQPLVWNKRTGYVVGGHQRLSLLEHKGVDEVACVVVDLPEDREKALNVALNNDEVGGDWDTDKLLTLLDELRNAPDVDATLTGFNDDELRELLLAPAPVEMTTSAEEIKTHVDVTIEVPCDRWTETESWVQALLDAEPTVRVHVAS